MSLQQQLCLLGSREAMYQEIKFCSPCCWDYKHGFCTECSMNKALIRSSQSGQCALSKTRADGSVAGSCTQVPKQTPPPKEFTGDDPQRYLPQYSPWAAGSHTLTVLFRVYFFPKLISFIRKPRVSISLLTAISPQNMFSS